MYELKIITKFGAAHQLRNFGGKCENLHGHNWKIEVYVIGEKLDDTGLLVDFGLIKQKTEAVISQLDHTFLNELNIFKETNPSSENIARFVFNALSKVIDSKNVKISRVTAWESDTACATYMMES